VLPIGPREAAALVAEQLALDELRRHGAAVSGRKAESRRRDSSCTVSAASSLPVPLSPMSMTVAEVGATRLSWSYNTCIRGELPRMRPKRPSLRSSSRNSPISCCSAEVFLRAATQPEHGRDPLVDEIVARAGAKRRNSAIKLWHGP